MTYEYSNVDNHNSNNYNSNGQHVGNLSLSSYTFLETTCCVGTISIVPTLLHMQTLSFREFKRFSQNHTVD